MTAQASGQETVSLLGVGDVGGNWHLYDTPETIYTYVAPTVREADIAFAHLEATWTNRSGLQKSYASAWYAMQDPDAPGDGPKHDYSSFLAKCGFNVASVCGNHGMDWGPEGLLDTMENLRRAGIAPIGGGKNIQEARAPAVLERKGVRVAMLGYVSVIPPGAEARERAAGMAPMRAHTFYEQVDPQSGTPHTRVFTVPHREDLGALVDDVRNAKAQADAVVLSMHWGVHHLPKVIADYQIHVAHAAIDAGADLILGHHPHILKGIEVYKGKVCFYGLCNFLHASPIPRGRGGPKAALYDYGPRDPDYPLYSRPVACRMAVVAKALISTAGIQHVSYLPVWINGQAQPRILSSDEPEFKQTVDYMRDITGAYFKTSFRVEGNEVVVYQ